MDAKFQIQDLVEESPTRTIHRVRGSDGEVMRLTRILLDEKDRQQLKRSRMLQEALDELKALRHPFLAEVLDCGLDEQGIPWVVSRWINGNSIDEVKINEPEIQTVSKHARGLLDDFGPVAGAVNFDTAEIFFPREERESCIFLIDYFQWFYDIAAGLRPGANRDGTEEVRQLLSSLAIKQLQLPKKKEEKVAIPIVVDESPELRTYQPVMVPWFWRLLVWLFMIGALLAIGWLTVEGIERVDENPRLEGWKLKRER